MREILGWIGVAVLVLAAVIGYFALFAHVCKGAVNKTLSPSERRAANVAAIMLLLGPFAALAVWGLA